MWQLEWEKKTRIDDDISTGRCSRFHRRGGGRRKVRIVDSEKCVFDGTIVLTAFFCCCCSKRTYTQKISTLLRFRCVRLKIGLAILVQANAGFFIGPSLKWISMSEIYQNRRKLNDDSRMRNVVVCRARRSLAIPFFFLAAQKQNNEPSERKEFTSHVNIVPCRRPSYTFKFETVSSVKWRCEFYSKLHEIDAIARFRFLSQARAASNESDDRMLFFGGFHVVIDLFELGNRSIAKLSNFFFVRNVSACFFYLIILRTCFLVFVILAARTSINILLCRIHVYKLIQNGH